MTEATEEAHVVTECACRLKEEVKPLSRRMDVAHTVEGVFLAGPPPGYGSAKNGMNVCPVCEGPAVRWCKCFHGNRWCASDHHWRPCPQHKEERVLIPDKDDHSFSNKCACGQKYEPREEDLAEQTTSVIQASIGDVIARSLNTHHIAENLSSSVCKFVGNHLSHLEKRMKRVEKVMDSLKRVLQEEVDGDGKEPPTKRQRTGV